MTSKMFYFKIVDSASVVGTLGCFTHAAYQQRRSLQKIKPILQSTLVYLECQQGRNKKYRLAI